MILAKFSKRLIAALALGVSLAAPSAHAVELGVVGGALNPRYSTKEATDTAYVGTASPYGGVLLGFGMLETGVIYSQQNIGVSTSTSSSKAKYTFVDVPVMLRVESGRTSMGFGFYYSKFLSYTLGGTSVTGVKHDNYGATANLRFRLFGGLSIESRINLMMKDEASNSGNNTYFHNLMTGLVLFI